MVASVGAAARLVGSVWPLRERREVGSLDELIEQRDAERIARVHAHREGVALRAEDAAQADRLEDDPRREQPLVEEVDFAQLVRPLALREEAARYVQEDAVSVRRPELLHSAERPPACGAL